MLDVGAKMAKKQAPRKPTFGQRQIATAVAIASSCDNDQIGCDLARLGRQLGAVIEDQWRGPDAKLQVVDDRAELSAEICPSTYSRAKSGGEATGRGAGNNQGQQEPRRSQRRIKAAPPPPRFAEGTGQKGPIVEQRYQGGRYHHLLGGHPQQARQKRH